MITRICGNLNLDDPVTIANLALRRGEKSQRGMYFRNPSRIQKPKVILLIYCHLTGPDPDLYLPREIEMTSIFPVPPPDSQPDANPYSFLEDAQIRMIDEALSSLGEYGELRLVVEKGRLRFLITQKSFDALKWKPGSLDSTDR